MHCTYLSSPPCLYVEWIVEIVCDKCGAEAELDLCDHHFQMYRKYRDKGNDIACSECYGTISFVAQHLYDGGEEAYVNEEGLHGAGMRSVHGDERDPHGPRSVH